MAYQVVSRGVLILQNNSMEFFLNEQEFTEFSEFRESDKSLKHELGLI